MSKSRYINTKFWVDSYITRIDPIEKLLFLYFLTNQLTNVAGIYEIPLRQIAFDTGIDKEMVLKVLERFQKEGKIFYINGWVYIKNFSKHQKLNDNMKKGVKNCLKDVPDEIKASISEIQRAFESLSNDSERFELSKPKSKLKSKSKHNEKPAYGEFKNVKLTNDEFQKLESTYGETNTFDFITRLDGYVESKGKKYKSHYATILNWMREGKIAKLKPPEKPKENIVDEKQRKKNINRIDQIRSKHKIKTI